jgi:hypothetical protein
VHLNDKRHSKSGARQIVSRHFHAQRSFVIRHGLACTLTSFPSGGVVSLLFTAGNTVAIAPPAGVTDPVLSNNTSTLNLYSYSFPIIFNNAP